ncbi:hypothetical protein COV19_03705 [Candidatus Woesearchaeota archaeon CG10_big_fil_rev_8_21_14_0_10_44_13]|nr:MAG: hypothetical protein COV19_03705 [Candidatus Woesearchaeota archaeon CG10_big_fil_rev_8_21_14_0_10_44_13]
MSIGNPKPDFSRYSLALIRRNKIIFSSDKEGIRPLVECVRENEGQCNEKECILHDKVVGLAAARLIVHMGCISYVHTDLCSIPAKELLESKKIGLEAKMIVDNILNKDRSGICRMELKAMEIKDDEKFFSELSGMFSDADMIIN